MAREKYLTSVLIEKIHANLFIYLFVYFYPDLDECQAFPNSCHLNAECRNTPGSYSCHCRPGYQGDGLNCTCEFSILWSHFDATSKTNQLGFLSYHVLYLYSIFIYIFFKSSGWFL